MDDEARKRRSEILLEIETYLGIKGADGVQEEADLLAQNYLNALNVEAGQTRYIDIRSKLASIAEAAHELRRELETTDPHSDAFLFFGNDNSIEGGSVHESALEKAGLCYEHRSTLLPDSGAYPEEHRLILQLRALEDRATDASVEVPRDRGGNITVEKVEFGAAKFQLAYECLSVFERFRPNEATGTEGGPYHLFIEKIHELATGESDGKFDKIFKKALQVKKRVHDTKEKIQELETSIRGASFAGAVTERRELEHLYELLDNLLRGRLD